MRYSIVIPIVVGLCAAFALGQSPTSAPATQPAGADQQFQARVVKVDGNVSYAIVDAQGVQGAWQPAKVGDVLPAGTQIRTRLRSKVVMAFGDDTVVMIDRATLASIDQFHRRADTKVVRLGLGHGAIRAGVAETTLRSDMTIDTPTATLSKKGTMDFQMEYEPVSGRFRISLAQEGLVQALNKLTMRSLAIGPGQYVTQAMARWIETATFDRFVAISDVFSLTDSELSFQAFGGEGGTGSVDPGGGAENYSVTGRLQSLAAQNQQRRLQQQFPTQSNVTDRPEGNFGTGGGLLPALFGKSKLRKR